MVAADVSRLTILGISFEIRADSRPLLQFRARGPACRHLERFHLSGSADILVCGFAGHSCPVFHPYESGDWKVARTRRLESLRYIITVNPDSLIPNSG